MSKRISNAFAVTENGVYITPFEKAKLYWTYSENAFAVSRRKGAPCGGFALFSYG